MAIKWRSKTLLAKIESSYGTDPVPTAAANGVLAMNVSLSPMEGEDVTRNLERPTLGANPSLPVGLRSVLSFEVELVGSGTLGTAPAWGPLLRMCAVAQVVTAGVKVEYSPVSDNHESGAIYFAIDTTRHVLLGARGNAVIKLNAQGIPVIAFNMIGIFTVPTDVVKVNPDYSAWQAPLIATKTNTPTFTIGATPFVLRDFELDLGNDVQPRMLIGSESILIVDKQEKLTTRVEAVPVTTYDPFTAAQTSAPKAIQIIHGTAANKRVQIDVPTAIQQRLTAYENNQNILEWPLNWSPQPTVGNDQWKITLA